MTKVKPVTTVTVNQWRIKSNAETGQNEPVICVNTYAYKRDGRWGPQIEPTRHYDQYTPPEGKVKVVHDPVNKTPCGASCWMEIEHA